MSELVDGNRAMKDRLKFILDGAEVSRYHTVRTIHPESVGHHCHGVAVICYLIDPSADRDLLIAALVHDLAEHQLGDIPSPAKREHGIGEKMNELEESLLRDVGLDVKLSEKNARSLKIADLFQGMCTCLREIQMGNTKMITVFCRYVVYAEEMNLTGSEKELFDIIVGGFRER